MKHNRSTPCCPMFDPEPWEKKVHRWKDKPFVRDEVRQLFHVPLNMKGTVVRMWNKIQAAGAAVPVEEFIMLAYDPSPWKSEIYINVSKDVPGAEMVSLFGIFLSRVFDGPYNAVPKWIKEMDRYVESEGRKVLKYYFYYTTCPKCAKLYGRNPVVAFAQVES